MIGTALLLDCTKYVGIELIKSLYNISMTLLEKYKSLCENVYKVSHLLIQY